MADARQLKATLKKAIETHVAGRLDEAAELYAVVLGQAPAQPVANFNFGILLAQRGRPFDALHHLGLAHAARPRREEFLRTFAQILMANGRHDQAIATLVHAEAGGVTSGILSGLLAIARNRGSPAAGAHGGDGISRAAEPSLRKVDRIVWLIDRKVHGDAAAAAAAMAREWPAHGIAWKLLGRIELDRGRPDLALAVLLRSVALVADDGAAHFLLAQAQGRLEQPRRAVASLERAAILRPHHADSWKELGHALRDLGYLDRSACAFHRAVALNPALEDCQCALSNIGEILGQHPRAERWVAAAFDLTGAGNQRGEQTSAFMEEILLRTGRPRKGWSFAHCFATRHEGSCEILPFLEALRAGRRAWVRVTDLKDLARGVLDMHLLAPLAAYPLGIACPSRLHSLAARSFPNWIFAGVGEAIEGNPLVLSSRSVPSLAMELDREEIRAPALRADPQQSAMLSASLRSRFPGRILVGLSWRSSLRANPHALNAPTDLRIRELEAEMRPGFDTRLALWRKLVPISHLDVLRGFERCAFISIQYGVEPAEAAFIEQRGCLPIHFPAGDFSGPIDDAAALISALDAVVSIPNSHAHLAAALGRPTFVLLHDVPTAIWAAQAYERLYPDVELCAKPWRREEDGRYLFGYNGDWRPALLDALERICRRHE